MRPDAQLATPQQIANWRSLSVGLARHWDITITDARREKLVDYVADCIDIIVDKAVWKGQPHKLGDWDVHVSDRVEDYLWDRGLLLEGKMNRKGDYINDRTRGRLGNQICCCIRAGFDVAIRPSAGVIGFTLGDLRSACGGVLPEWVRSFFDLSDGADLDYMDDAEELWL